MSDFSVFNALLTRKYGCLRLQFANGAELALRTAPRLQFPNQSKDIRMILNTTKLNMMVLNYDIDGTLMATNVEISFWNRTGLK